MANKGKKTPRTPIGNPADPNSLYAFMLHFLEAQRIKNYSERTLEGREAHLRYFIGWCEDRGLSRPQAISKPVVERYQRHLFHYRKKNGEPLSIRSQHTRLIPLRAYFKWLAQENYILYNPAADIELPRLEQRLPKHVLTQAEAELILNQPDLQTAFGLRDRAILETFYSTGIRRQELIDIKLHDLDSGRGTLMIRQGKGKKDRMVPIGERALGWIAKYCDEVRPKLSLGCSDNSVFLSYLGKAFGCNQMTALVRGYITAADIGKEGSCHLFRHTMATLMLENGADIRYIQAMLGHADMSTTQIYTQVSIRALKEIHTATHPAKAHRGSELPDSNLSALAAEEAEEL